MKKGRYTDEPVKRLARVAREIIRAAAKYNALGVDLDGVNLFLDPDAGDVELTTDDKPLDARFSQEVGTLAEFDPYGSLILSDADNRYILDVIQDLLFDVLEESKLND